ncbi:sigma-70 family RNA polymerase sigma factor [Coralliovum pocilloporae]|uniref:sigma-70 family RNA polymerase sigma factor n=1 Tax=Coralliovum pocilloporae TaxID=3066369 RepID=UPI003306AACC
MAERQQVNSVGDDDHDLVRRIAEGDKEAMRRLYSHHHLRVYRFILRFISNSATAEDLTNDVFIDVWQQAGRFEFKSKVSTWLLGMARFKALSEIRKTRISVDPDDALGEMEDDADTPEVTAQKRDKGAALRACIEKLTPDHREVIDLVYYHEKSIKEISEIVGISENTVKTRMFHARKKLSVLMQRAGIDRGWP